MIDDLEPLLARLPEPAPPPTLAATVMARVARVPDRASADIPSRSPATTRREWSAWVSVAVGLTLVIAPIVQGWSTVASLPELASARIGARPLMLIPVDGPGVLLLAVGSWLFLVGLFAPLRGGMDIETRSESR